MSESVPSSVTGFAHRRPRSDSVASFTYFQEEDESPEWSDDQAIVDDGEGAADLRFHKQAEDDVDFDLESGSTSPQRRKSSGPSRDSVEHPLLDRHDSLKDVVVLDGGTRCSQKIYLVTEDLTIVVAGFVTKSWGFLLYVAICVLSLGLGFLFLRWLPRWRVRLIGSPRRLRQCDWVVIEVRSSYRHRKSKAAAETGQNQWSEFTVERIDKISYGHAASTVFGLRQQKGSSLDYDEDDDPVLNHLRFLDYRYIRFCFHPSLDKFVLCSDWKDPNWTNVRTMRTGMDSDERHRREQVFGFNQIDIRQKSIPQLLVDEARIYSLETRSSILILRRHSILSTSFKSPVSSSGLWTNTTIMPSVSSLFRLSASRQP